MESISRESVCLQEILKGQAESKVPSSVLFYSLGDTTTARKVSCDELYNLAHQNSAYIRSLRKFREGRPILLHLSDHWETILWFWSIVLAKGLPVLSSPLSNVANQRHRHLERLSSLLESPICITSADFVPLFTGDHSFELHTICGLQENTPYPCGPRSTADIYERRMRDLNHEYIDAGRERPAVLMLTSGSTGDVKAVCLSHDQVLAAIKGKANVRSLPSGGPFLNWIGLDHVASLVEIHLQAMWLGVDQIHAHAADVVSRPQTFLDLLSKHHVARSFAPNFFLAKLVASLQHSKPQKTWDLSGLTILASGGEANDVQTCAAASALLETFGASRNVITPGFGMTETCAGAIFNLECPEYDMQQGHSTCSLGKCMDGIDMRVTKTSDEGISNLAEANEPGDLEVKGKVVFSRYHRNPTATAEAFTSDGWFRTGDQATIDSLGQLRLIGRTKDVVNLNGVKFPSGEIQSAIEQALEHRVGCVYSFPSRSTPSTEQITVAYIPKEPTDDYQCLMDIDEIIIGTCVMYTGHVPLVFLMREESRALVPTSTLGKVSRAKLRSLFEEGVFSHDLELHLRQKEKMKQQRSGIHSPADDIEAFLHQAIADTLSMNDELIGFEDLFFELGCSSTDLIRLKYLIDSHLGTTVPIVVLMRNPTIRSLAAILRPLVAEEADAGKNYEAAIEYDPIVTLRSTGTKTPLWLIHPGVGEVLVFVGLAQHMADDDRAVYALRARGFEPGQEKFESIDEVVATYVAAIRRKQPQGPYALAGYSYGSMIAFEMAKKLNFEAAGQTVQFLGCFNLPPHIKTRMRQLNWNMCLLHLAYFLDFISEETAGEIEDAGFRDQSRENAMRKVFRIAEKPRMAELGLGEAELARWADVAFGLQSMATDYEPGGMVDSLDVFHAIPLRTAAATREEWMVVHLSKWSSFCRTEPVFHEVGGAHYTMLSSDHVSEFSVTLRAALKARGL